MQKLKVMSGLKSYRELDVWHVAITVVETTYRVTRAFPDSERYGLVSQMQRAATSIPSNIAEGQARGTPRFGLHYIRMALGSAAELDTQLELARRLRFVTVDQAKVLDEQLMRLRQMLYGMRREHLRRLTTSDAG